MKIKETGLRLVVDTADYKLANYLASEVTGEKSNSSFVNQMESFCDALDAQIDEIMNM